MQHISAFKPTQLVAITNLLSKQSRSIDLRSSLLPINPVLKKYAAASLLSLASLTAYAVTFDDSQFLMFSNGGATVGNFNDVSGSYNPSMLCNDVSCTNTNAMTLASPSPFFGSPWTAHDIRVFGPGTYTFDTDCTGEDINAGRFDCDPSGPEITVTVGPGQVAGHILFDWNTATDIHIPVLWDDNGYGYPGILSLDSVDGDGDDIPGFAMVNGPFPGFQANFNLDASLPLTPTEPYPPICANPTFITKQDEPLNIYLVNDLKSSCYSPYGVHFDSYSSVPITTGSLFPYSFETDTFTTYTPAPGFTGTDSFEFTVFNYYGYNSDTVYTDATAYISVLANPGNFTVLDENGYTVGGTNDVSFDWDQTVNTAESDTNFNITIVSDNATPLFGSAWTTHHARVFGSGTYSFDSGCSIAEVEATGCPAGSAAASGPAITLTVADGQFGAHILFDYNGSLNIDIVNVWDIDSAWDDHGEAAPRNELWQGADGTASDPVTIWQLVSRDVNSDGINGSPILEGALSGYSANFNKGPGAIDPDSDGDNVTDSNDNCPVDFNSDQADSDSDNVGDACDLFPFDPSETFDSDSDGVGDNADAFPTNIAASVDDDNDGLPDTWNASCNLTCQNNSGLTLDEDTTPNQFNYYDRTSAQLNRQYNSTNSIQVSGINADAPISIIGGEYSIDGGTWTSASATVSVFSRVLLRQSSASTGSTQTDAVLTIGSVSATFSVTTKVTDTTPNQFSYYDRTGAQLNRLYNSTNSIQVSGINADSPISITGGEYSIDGGAWTSASGTVSVFSRVLLRQTSAFTGLTTANTVLTIGGVSATFSTTTKAGSLDTTPNQFSYYDRTNAQLNRLFNSTNSIQVSGINTDAPISITGGEYRIDGGAWTSASGTVSVFSRVLLRQTSAATNNTQTDTVLTIGGISATFSITTKP